MFHPVEMLNEWDTHTNRPRQDLHPSELYGLWSRADGQAPEAELGRVSDEPELMVVVTTYGRPHAAAKVLSRLGNALRARGLEGRTALLVLHDACDGDYTAVRSLAQAAAARCLWLDARRRLGKPGFWKVHQTALLVARAWRPKRALYLQDDIDFEPDFLTRSDELWRATEHDPLRRVLHLFASQDDEEDGRWVSFARRELPGVGCRLTGWFDLSAFMVDRKFFELLDYRMVPIHPNRWKRKPEVSSGVGRQLTLRLFRRAHVYQAWPPLVRHGSQPSVMNPEARLRRPMDNLLEWVADDEQRTHPGVSAHQSL